MIGSGLLDYQLNHCQTWSESPLVCEEHLSSDVEIHVCRNDHLEQAVDDHLRSKSERSGDMPANSTVFYFAGVGGGRRRSTSSAVHRLGLGSAEKHPGFPLSTVTLLQFLSALRFDPWIL